ncbi:Protein CBG25292 [Caenorhabditis briggsae]|uniref:Protein CBG25292 n=1 Tax=Caenorhabditis briggsae TaxID=6238 RepID=B6IIG2_CAEBR|nr:Protein CBG25292 [Caenorhabditis briggsae]CAR99692.1 Protein CBG25292 [Caenorhabditis briggsae]
MENILPPVRPSLSVSSMKWKNERSVLGKERRGGSCNFQNCEELARGGVCSSCSRVASKETLSARETRTLLLLPNIHKGI